MGNNKMVIIEKSRDIGDFIVGRLLPFRRKRQVGPFTFIDHMGPTIIGNGRYLDVDQHPHIGLSALTYLLEGEVEHKDSTGAQKIITPGDVGFMTAGRGVVHTERTPSHLRTIKTTKLHGYQVWIALPKDKEEMDPHFQFVEKNDLPSWEENNMQITLIAGSGFGKTSPLKVFSPLFMVDILAKKKTRLNIKDQLQGEIAISVIQGTVSTNEHTIEDKMMLISKTENECHIDIEEGTRLLLFGGERLTEDRFLYWNFVSSSLEPIERAKYNWKKRQFPKVADDYTYTPLP